MAFLRLHEETAAAWPMGRPALLIFTEGTILGPERWWKWFNDKGYVPIGQSVAKINTWQHQGAKIAYLTSRKTAADVLAIRVLLTRNGFPGEYLFYRGGGERYSDIAEQVIPDILIEDDCRSIGGRWQMTIPAVKDEIKRQIHSIVVPEFRGIDALPDDLRKLHTWQAI